MDVKTQSPQVSQVATEDVGQLVDCLNRWRDGMPALAMAAESQAFAVTVGDEIVGGYVMRGIGPANEIGLLAIDPAHRRQGHGRMCLLDALFRSGKRPLVLTVDETSAGFAKAVGFKIIGKRMEDGETRYRFGWHAPRPGSDPSNRSGC